MTSGHLRRAQCNELPRTTLATDPPLVAIGLLPWAYDPADYPGFTPAQVRAGLTVPACC